jgi:hypothetical protein
MAHNHTPDEELAWNQLLQQLREQPAPPLRPYFYTRLQSRLHAPAEPQLAWWLRRPVYLAVLGLLMLALHADSGQEAAVAPAPPPTQATK